MERQGSRGFPRTTCTACTRNGARSTNLSPRPGIVRKVGINKEERGMRAQDNGHLTAQDRRTINHQQTVESRRIYRAKH